MRKLTWTINYEQNVKKIPIIVKNRKHVTTIHFAAILRRGKTTV